MAIEKQFTIKVNGIDKFVSSLEEAEKLTEEIKNSLESIDSLEEQADLKESLATLKNITGEFEAIEEAANITAEALAKGNEEIGKAFKSAEKLLEKSEAQATVYATVEGSIARLNAELELATLNQDDLVIGSKEYLKAKANVEELTLQLEAASLSTQDIKQLNADLASGFAQTFTGGAGLVQSFTGDNEQLQQAILAVEQALAAVEVIRSASETLALLQQKKRISQGKNLIKQKQEETKASIENRSELIKEREELKKVNEEISNSGEASSKGAEATTKLGGGFKGAISSVKAFGASLISTGIPIIVGAIVALGAGLLILKDRIPGVAKLFNTLGDIIGGITEVVKAFIPAAISGFTALADGIKSFINFDFKEGLDKLSTGFKDSFDKVSDAVTKAGDNFDKGVEKSIKKRELAELTAINNIKKANIDALANRLGLEAKNEAQISKLKQEQLKQDIEIQKKNLKLNSELNDAEIAGLQSTNQAVIKATIEKLKLQGKYNEEVLTQIQDLNNAEVELETERINARNAELDRAQEIANLKFDLVNLELEKEKGLAVEIKKLEIEKEKTILDINTRIAKGEIVNKQERLIAEKTFANAKLQLEEDLADELEALNDKTAKQEFDRVTATREKQAQEAKNFNELALIEQDKFNQQKLALQKQAEKEADENPDKKLQIQAQLNEDLLGLEKTKSEKIKQIRQDEVDFTNKVNELQEQNRQLFLNNQIETLDKLASNEDLFYKDRINALEEASLKRTDIIQSNANNDLKNLKLNEEQIKTLQTQGVEGLLSSFPEVNKEIALTGKNIVDQASLAIDKERETTEQVKQDILEAQKVIGQGLNDTINQIGGFATDALSSIGSILNDISQASIRNLDEQLSSLNNTIEDVDSQIQERTDKINELTNNLKTAREEDKDSILKAINAEKKAQNDLQKNIENNVNKQKELEQQKKEEQRKAAEQQKAIQLAQAIINGALAITNVLATVPKFDFGIISAIQLAITAASVAAQISTIASTPIPEFSEGGFTGKGSKLTPAGIVHAGEYVIPKEIVESPRFAPSIQNLERARLNKSYASGGQVTTAEDIEASQIKVLSSVFANLRPVVSVQDINVKNKKLQQVQARATL